MISFYVDLPPSLLFVVVSWWIELTGFLFVWVIGDLIFKAIIHACKHLYLVKAHG